MQLPSDLVLARFVKRLNRFAAVVEVDGREVMAHVANSGRMRELLAPGCVMYLKAASGNHRKTWYDLALVEIEKHLCSADARLPPYLVAEAIARGKLPQFRNYTTLRREVVLGRSRVDMALQGPEGLCYIETKSVTLVEGGVGLFPDAPTERGRRHVLELAEAVESGHRGAVVFVVQRRDAVAFSPHYTADPAFGEALREAIGRGVEVYAYNCRVSRSAISLNAEISVRL
ncbi:MAG: DNA/RNA nuclease SfsA [SAR202 cluster bacterium]|nr:DNA/RNA nuclease SfsA [SAR202 cluster bacterium]